MRHHVDASGALYVDQGLGFLGAANLLRGKPRFPNANTPINSADDCVLNSGTMATNDYWNSGRGQFCTYVECRLPLDPWDEASYGASERVVTLPGYTDCWYPPTYGG